MAWPSCDCNRRVIRQDFGFQIRYRQERATCEHFAHQDGEPDFDLIHPRAMSGRVMEHHLVGGIAQKGGSPGHQRENTVFALLAKVLLDARKLSDESGPATRIDGC